jgi:Rhodopirellula transposase DDE domain
MLLEPMIREKFDRLRNKLDEKARRLWVANEALAIGKNGIAALHRATGISRKTIARGIRELITVESGAEGNSPESVDATPPLASSPKTRIRKPGGGRKRTADTDATLVSDLEILVAPATRGDPESPLRWCCKSVRKLAAELNAMGHKTSHRMVAELLHKMDYSLQANSKTTEGGQHPDRDAQFQHISNEVARVQASGQPVISVDTKKKELVGDFKNSGREWSPKGTPEKVRVHDFIIPELGRASPYGVYDLSSNEGWVNVGADNDTSAFAVESIRRWWEAMGKPLYAEAGELLITADGGGSNSSRARLWKTELQRFADEANLTISVCHFPPGTSKWNKIEHRLFSFISMNWRGKPLTSHEVMVELIGSTKNTKGLKVRAVLDRGKYPKGVKVSKAEFDAVNIQRNAFHGEWNYQIKPTGLL